MAATSVRDYETDDDRHEGEYAVCEHQIHEERSLEWALVEVFTVGFLQLLLPCVVHEGARDQEEDECTAYASSVGDEYLRLLEKEDDYYDGNRDYD